MREITIITCKNGAYSGKLVHSKDEDWSNDKTLHFNSQIPGLAHTASWQSNEQIILLLTYILTSGTTTTPHNTLQYLAFKSL